ncbi:MAG TPA: selenide, water dikinase SelD [Clostridiaceae bacterium]|nr:selenide, water dikinase SelD [Clostridiaceae bacterium]
MSREDEILFCKGGGCTAKLGAGVLAAVLAKLPKQEEEPRLLVGFDSTDDAAVYQLTDQLAVVQTLDFFPPMLEDPYTFGQVAAANALSDIYAMGGKPIVALNIVCFPEQDSMNILGRIMQGGQEKVNESGAILAGGHSIADDSVKYGLSVCGILHPDRIIQNNTGQPGDHLILTKPLGVGIVCTAERMNAASPKAMKQAVDSMTTLNRQAAEIAHDFEIHACTDITGFGFLGHISEMIKDRIGARIDSLSVPHIPEAVHYAADFYITGAGQKNRSFVGDKVNFQHIPFGMEEVLFDPQTSGGLLFAVAPQDAAAFLKTLREAEVPAADCGRLTDKTNVIDVF